MSNEICPLCRDARHMRRRMPLYGVPVCRKCYYKFANRRQLAYLLDWIIFRFVVVFLMFGLAFMLATAQINDNDADLVLLFVSWIVLPLIFFLKDGFAGHSLGKAVCGVMVVNQRTYQPIWFGRSLLRNLPLIVPFVPLIVAFLLQKGYRWGDGWAKTKVIWKKYANHPVFTGKLACENCQYDLTGNTTGICPECGTPVPLREPTPQLAP